MCDHYDQKSVFNRRNTIVQMIFLFPLFRTEV